MKYIKQFRYYGPANPNNYPPKDSSAGDGIETNALVGNTYFTNYTPITKIGLQTLPGTKFYLNDLEKQHPIIVGYTGIYELDIEGVAEINSLSFDLESINRINNLLDAYLIIDIVYEKDDE